MGVFTKTVIEIEIEIRGQSGFTKNVIEINFNLKLIMIEISYEISILLGE